MPTLSIRISFTCVCLLTCCTAASAQLQVSKEPMHHPAIVNEYLRVLDVHIPPGDTTKFHVHSTPSLFIHLTTTNTSTQVKSESWIADRSETGKTWYKSFTPDILFHRVCNRDTSEFHVLDVELLKPYNAQTGITNSPLPFPVFLSNEKAFVYKLNNAQVQGMNISGRGPIVVILVSGGPVSAENLFAGSSADLKAGEFLYIAPGTDYHFTCKDKGELNMVIFELK